MTLLPAPHEGTATLKPGSELASQKRQLETENHLSCFSDFQRDRRTRVLLREISGCNSRSETPSSSASSPPTSKESNLSTYFRREDGNSATASFIDTGPDETVCFGALPSITTQVAAVKQPDSLQFRHVGKAIDNLVELNLVMLEETGEIRSDDGVTLAQVSTKTHLALRRLSHQHGANFLPLINEGELREKLRDALSSSQKSTQDKVVCSMELLVSGHRQMSGQIAKVLAEFKLFLQNPLPYTTLLSYENPQYLKLQGNFMSTGLDLPPLSGEWAQVLDDDVAPQGDAIKGSRHRQTDVQKVLDSIPAIEGLRTVETDGRVRTNLLSHQKQGVDFITRRETRNDFGSGLWKLDLASSSFEHVGFRHRITGARRPQPEDFPGGLLADDMGLGKTLMMISSIVATLDNALHHAYSQRPSTSRASVPVMSTLVLVPSVALMDMWESQIEHHVLPGTLSIYRYHGQGRRLDPSSPLPYHVVFSTYATVASDFSRGGGVLSKFQWYRLILDEAHVIRNWTTQQFGAVNDLVANIRWCMTGTPIQNTVDDLGSLIKFLRVPSLSDSSSFRKHISGTQKGGHRFSTPSPENLRLLLGSMCLRRGKSVLSLPGVTEHRHAVSFSGLEKVAYRGLVEACDRSIAAAISGHHEKQTYKTVLAGLLRQRLFCNVGLEARTSQSAVSYDGMSEVDQVISILQQGGGATCVSCHADVLGLDEPDSSEDAKPRLSHCHRLICGECVQELPRGQDNRKCPACNEVHDGDIFLDCNMQASTPGRGSMTVSPIGRQNEWPSKLLVLGRDLEEHLKSDKSIVFSFWRQSLDVLGRLLAERGIPFYRVDGMLKPERRREVLRVFRSPDSARVLLMTLGTGSVGLNDLDVASRLHFMEPQWNPAVESQAVGRLLRLGQEKQVCIVRYVVKDSIEEKVESQQITKIRLASAGGLHSARGESGMRNEQLKELQKALHD